MKENLKKDFELYSRDYGVGTLGLGYHKNRIQNSLTPYILEEREMNMTQIDVFSRLMGERIIWIAGPITDSTSVVVQAQLMYLDSIGENDITIHVDTPGGSIKAGLSIVDLMEYINSDVRTINTGMAASMGSVLLGAGTVGKRLSLKSSKTMIHQSSSGIGGNIQDAEIEFTEWKKTNEELFKRLAGYCKKTAEQVKKDAQRDLWFDAEETLAYGLIDEVITKKR